MTSPSPLDAAARDELRAKAEALRAAITACPPFKFTIEPHVNGSAYLSDAQSEVWQAFMALTYACTPDVILALLAAVERGAEDTARLRGLERFACVIETRTSEGYQERFERDSDEEFADWLDFVIANTDANQQDELAARSATPTEGDDHA